MKAVGLLTITLLASPWVQAESIATGGLLDPVVRIITTCKECKKMNDMSNNIFARAHKNFEDKAMQAKAINEAKKSIADVTNHADRLAGIAEQDAIMLRNAHYANEITAFYYLAAEALPYAEDVQIADTIAYLNHTLGSRDLFLKVLADEVLSRPENDCRKTFFQKAVEVSECNLAKALAEEKAAEEKNKKTNNRAVTKVRACEALTFSVPTCEAKKAARARIK